MYKGRISYYKKAPFTWYLFFRTFEKSEKTDFI